MRVTPIDPNDYVAVVGRTFAVREHVPILVLGRHSWNRLQLARLGVPHIVAAANLHRVCRELRITTIAGLAAHAQEIGRYKGCGVTCYWLVLAILRAHGYSVTEVHGEPVTYTTIKQRARKAQNNQRRRAPRRAGPPSESAAAVH